MTRDRFTQLLDAYGGDSKRWPEAERADALAFAKSDRTAEAALDEARKLDALLAVMTVNAPAIDAATIVTAAAQLPQERAPNVLPFKRRFGGRPALAWTRAGALAAAAICGFVIGMNDVADSNASALDLFDAVQVEETTW